LSWWIDRLSAIAGTAMALARNKTANSLHCMVPPRF
jgi:hypothetical protein